MVFVMMGPESGERKLDKHQTVIIRLTTPWEKVCKA